MEIQKLPSYPERRLHLPRQTDSFPPLSIPISIGPSGTLQDSDTGAVTATASQSSQSGDTQSQSSQSASTPAPTSDSTSGSSSDDQSATDSSSGSASPSATPSATATSTQSASDTSTTDSSSSSDTPTPSSSSPTPTSSPSSSSTTDSASSSSTSTTSGVSLTTFTSSFVSDINGTPTTIETPIVTALNTDQPRSAASSRRTAIIAGSAVGGAALLILALAALFYVRRRASKQRYSFLARKPPPSRAAFLAGEDMDDPASGARYGEYAAVPREQYELPPRLFHASESGSVFQEAVWPPPSRLADPLRSASGADLARIVDDVMGPSSASRLRGGSWDANQSYDSLAHAQDRSYDSLAMRVGPQHEHAHGRDASVSSQTGLLPGPSPPPGAGFARSPLTLANPDAAEPATPPASAKPWLDRTPSPRHAPLHLPQVGEAL